MKIQFLTAGDILCLAVLSLFRLLNVFAVRLGCTAFLSALLYHAVQWLNTPLQGLG